MTLCWVSLYWVFSAAYLRLDVIMLSVIMLSVLMPNVIMLSVHRLNDLILCVIVMSVVGPFCLVVKKGNTVVSIKTWKQKCLANIQHLFDNNWHKCKTIFFDIKTKNTSCSVKIIKYDCKLPDLNLLKTFWN